MFYFVVWHSKIHQQSRVLPTKFVERNKIYFIYYYLLTFIWHCLFCLERLWSSLNYSTQWSASIYISCLTLRRFPIWVSRSHFILYRNMPKFFNSIILVKLIIFLCAMSLLFSSHSSFKMFSRHRHVSLQFSSTRVSTVSSTYISTVQQYMYLYSTAVHVSTVQQYMCLQFRSKSVSF